MDERILVDTDVLIDYTKGLVDLPRKRLYISEITLYEFIRGCKNVREVKALLESAFVVVFHDNDVLVKASEIWIELKKSGELIDERDILIASVAITKGMHLLTRNVKHFKKLEKFGLKLI
jgi:predicted nucleic acid-binding protein